MLTCRSRFVFTCLLTLSVSTGLLSARARTSALADPAFRKVSKTISLGRFKPTGLVPFQNVMISERTLPDLKKLLAAARKDGITLKVVSGYRSYKKQEKIFEGWIAKEMKKNRALTRAQAEALANTYSAKAGHSEHQLGTVVDVLSSENGYQFSSDQHLKYVSWLENNAASFNFTISYPKDSKEYVYEPWHIRWYPAQS